MLCGPGAVEILDTLLSTAPPPGLRVGEVCSLAPPVIASRVLMITICDILFITISVTDVHLGYTQTGRQERNSSSVRIESYFAFLDNSAAKLQTLS
jgi:hypothetical protein